MFLSRRLVLHSIRVRIDSRFLGANSSSAKRQTWTGQDWSGQHSQCTFVDSIDSWSGKISHDGPGPLSLLHRAAERLTQHRSPRLMSLSLETPPSHAGVPLARTMHLAKFLAGLTRPASIEVRLAACKLDTLDSVHDMMHFDTHTHTHIYICHATHCDACSSTIEQDACRDAIKRLADVFYE